MEKMGSEFVELFLMSTLRIQTVRSIGSIRVLRPPEHNLQAATVSACEKRSAHFGGRFFFAGITDGVLGEKFESRQGESFYPHPFVAMLIRLLFRPVGARRKSASSWLRRLVYIGYLLYCTSFLNVLKTPASLGGCRGKLKIL